MDRFITRTTKKVTESVLTESEPQPSTSGISQQLSQEIIEDVRSVDDDEVDACADRNVKKRKQYDVKYRENWQLEFKWLKKENDKAYCNICKKSIAGGKMHLRRHNDSELHTKNARKLRGSVQINTVLTNAQSQMLSKQIQSTELKLVMFAAEHNLPFLIFEHLPQFVSSLPGPEIMKAVTCSRTKATGLVNYKIGPFAQQAIANILKETYFSIIIDETTDISTSKCLVLVVRYYSQKEEKVIDSFFGLLELESATAESIFTVVINVFKKFDIPLTNIIGFASDNASVMMGHLNGVKAKFLEILPNIFVLGCLSHSLHLCASKACGLLPNKIENLARNIYNYFSQSAKRQHDFQDMQHFINVEPHKMLRPAQTRWLSLDAVVNRILEQWNALTLYFQSESLLEHVYGADDILNSLHDKTNKLYFYFLKHILKIVGKMNLEFQSEKPRIHTIIPTISMHYKTVLKFYMKYEIVNSIPLDRINPKNPDYFRTLEDIHFGAGFETLVGENHDISASQLNEVRVKCLNFYVELCSQIRSRVDFKNSVLNEVAEILDLDNLFNDNKPSIVKLANKFPNIHSNDVESLSMEWRLLNEYQPKDKFNNVEEFILFLRKQRDPYDLLVFQHLSNFFQAIISLPHSSAAAERIFSMLAIIKNKHRNSLNVSTVENLLFCKVLVNNSTCFKWEASDELLDFKRVSK